MENAIFVSNKRAATVALEFMRGDTSISGVQIKRVVRRGEMKGYSLMLRRPDGLVIVTEDMI